MNQTETTKPTPEEITKNLGMFIGTEAYHALSIFKNVVFTDGCKYVAESCGAFWLMGKIAAKLCEAYPTLDLFSITLKTTGKKGYLTFKWTVFLEDGSEQESESTEEIDYTDFPLPSIKFYAQRGGPKDWVLMLPSEY